MPFSSICTRHNNAGISTSTEKKNIVNWHTHAHTHTHTHTYIYLYMTASVV
jgi:hypothetical protein